MKHNFVNSYLPAMLNDANDIYKRAIKYIQTSISKDKKDRVFLAEDIVSDAWCLLDDTPKVFEDFIPVLARAYKTRKYKYLAETFHDNQDNRACKKCKEEKPIHSFRKQTDSRYGFIYHLNTCRICENKYLNVCRKKYLLNNREKYNKYMREYMRKHPRKIIKESDYYLKNRLRNALGIKVKQLLGKDINEYKQILSEKNYKKKKEFLASLREKRKQ